MSGWGEHSGHLSVGLPKSKKHRERGHHLHGFHYVVTFCSGVQTVDRTLTPGTSPSTAGCNLVGRTKQVGLWQALGGGERRAEEAGVGSVPAQITLTAVSVPGLSPALFSSCRTTSPSLTSQTRAATPRPRRPPRPPRRHPHSLPAPRPPPRCTHPHSARGNRRTSTCQVPPCLGSQGGRWVRARVIWGPVHA